MKNTIKYKIIITKAFHDNYDYDPFFNNKIKNIEYLYHSFII